MQYNIAVYYFYVIKALIKFNQFYRYINIIKMTNNKKKKNFFLPPLPLMVE